MQVHPIKTNGAHGVTPLAQTTQPTSLPCERRAARSPGFSAPPGDNGLAALVAMASQGRWEKRQVLYSGHDPADAFYRITKGIVAELKHFHDGRRQIVAIRTVGDLCGYPTRKGRYVFTGQAITPVEASAFGAEQFCATMERDTEFARAVADDVADRLNQALITLTVVGQRRSVERVAYFILDMEKRLRSPSISDGPIALHLTRGEIADYLGLTLETVSRAFSKLRQMRLIALGCADVVTVLDQKRLSEVAQGRL